MLSFTYLVYNGEDMSKNGDSKNKILDLLKTRKMTLTEISQELELAPSTVNQHLRELLAADAIKLVPNEFISKWKYYEATPQSRKTDAMKVKVKNAGLSNPFYGVVAALIVLGVAFAFFYGFGNSNSNSNNNGGYLPAQVSLASGAVPSGLTLFSISDSPTVQDISAVNVVVDSAAIHSQTTGKWYTVLSAPETFDLVQLNGISAMLSGASLSSGTYDEIVLHVASVSAVIGDQTQSVKVPSGTLKIFGTFNVSNSMTSWINIDVNLEKSLHITGNGDVILLPVLRVNNFEGSKIDLGANGIVRVNDEGMQKGEVDAGMDVNGNLQAGTQPVPQDAMLSINSGGPIVLLGLSPNKTITIQTEHGLIIIPAAPNTAGLSANVQSNINLIVPNSAAGSGPSGGGAGNAGYGGQEKLSCVSDTAQIHCIAIGGMPPYTLGQIISTQQTGVFGVGGTHGITTVSTNVVINGDETATVGTVSSDSGSTPIAWNVNANGVVDLSNPSNLPQPLIQDASCNTVSDCQEVSTSYCSNGLPTQNACINGQYMTQYSAWYTAAFGGTPAPGASSEGSGGGAGVGVASSGVVGVGMPSVGMMACPMYMLAVPTSCGCISNVCTLVAGPAAVKASAAST